MCLRAPVSNSFGAHPDNLPCFSTPVRRRQGCDQPAVRRTIIACTLCKHIHEHKSAIGRRIGVVDSFLKGEHSSFLCAKAKSMLSVQPVFKDLKISLPRYIRLIAFLWNSVAFFDIISPHFHAVIQLVYANYRVLEKPHLCGLPLIQITPCKRRTPAFPAPADTVPRSAPCGKRSNVLCFFLVCKRCGEKQSTTSFPVKIFC